MWKTTSLLASGLALASAKSLGARPDMTEKDLELTGLEARILNLERASVSRELWADDLGDGGKFEPNLANYYRELDAPDTYGAPAYHKRDTDLDEIACVEKPENEVLLKKLKKI